MGSLSSPIKVQDAYKRLVFQKDDLSLNRDNGTSDVPLAITVDGVTTMSLVDRVFQTVNIKDFGAVSSATVDNSDAIQAAIDYVASTSGKGIVEMPEGQYGIGKTIRMVNDVTIRGQGHFNTLVFGIAAFYTNTSATYDVATDSENIEDEDGYPVFFSATGGSSARPSQSHLILRDFGMYPIVYGTWAGLSHADQLYDATGVWGMLYETDFINVSSSGFRRGFHVGFNSGSITGSGFSYFGEIGLKLFGTAGFRILGHSFVGNVISCDVVECLGGSFDIHNETAGIAYRFGPKVHNAHVFLGHAGNIESSPIVCHPNAKVIVTGHPPQSQLSHSIPTLIHQTEVTHKKDDGHGHINYVPDGDMKDNSVTPAYYTKSGGGGGAAMLKRRALRKYTGTNETLNNYSGIPRLWCYPGGVAGDESTFEVQSGSVTKLGFLDVRFDCNTAVGVRVQVTDTGDSDTVIYDSGLIYGMHVAGNSKAVGEVVVAGDLGDLSGTTTGPYVIRFTTDSPDGFVVSRCMMYKSVSALNVDIGPISTLSYGLQAADSVTINVDDTTGFPDAGKLTVVNSTGGWWLVITYTGKTETSFTGCTATRRNSSGVVGNVADDAVINLYYADPSLSFQGFAAYDFNSGPDGADNQYFRLIVGGSLTDDIPHHTVGWMKSMGNPALVGNENARITVFDNNPSSSEQHNQFFLLNGNVYDDYDSGWTFVDLLSSSSYYLYLKKRSANVRMAGVGTLRSFPKLGNRFNLAATPTEGWWRQGDECIVAGTPYVCTVSGAPGTWAAMI